MSCTALKCKSILYVIQQYIFYSVKLSEDVWCLKPFIHSRPCLPGSVDATGFRPPSYPLGTSANKRSLRYAGGGAAFSSITFEV